jgi:hypothetical protein
MKPNHFTGVAVRVPTELRDILESMAIERGESLSLILRDCLREAVAARRMRGGQAVPQTAPSPVPTAGSFR